MSSSFPPNGFPLEHLEQRRLLSAGPAISISDVSLAEGDSGQTAFMFTVSLSAPSRKQVSVRYATESWSAFTGDNDFKSTSGTLNFGPGQTARSITVMVSGDTRVENNEAFLVKLSTPRNASIAKASGVGTIFNDDAPTSPPAPSWE